MSRTPRLLLPKSFYHIMARGNNRMRIFKSREDCDYFLNLIKRYKAAHEFDLYHFCLMPSHIHLLISTGVANDFSTFMKKLSLAYFHYFQRKYGWVGHLWQGRFKSQPVGKDQYFIQCGKYIELNPVRKGIVEKPEDYQYSSYRFYSFDMADELITPDFIYREMGQNRIERAKNYRDLVVGEFALESYSGEVWGGNRQRYREQDKINRKIKQIGGKSAR